LWHRIKTQISALDACLKNDRQVTSTYSDAVILKAKPKNPRISPAVPRELEWPIHGMRGFFPFATLKGQNDGLRIIPGTP